VELAACVLGGDFELLVWKFCNKTINTERIEKEKESKFCFKVERRQIVR